MTQQYTTSGLNRLYQAIREQAEQEFLEAINALLDLTEKEEALYLNYYRQAARRAELAIIEEAQSRGKQG